MSFEFFIAKRYLKSKRKTGFISVITYFSIAGVMIGVAALIIVLAVMNGFESEVRSRIIVFDAHIRLRAFHYRGVENYAGLIDQIKDINHIVGLSPYILEKAMIKSHERMEGIMIKGVDQETVAQVSDIKKNIIYGELKLGPVAFEEEEPLPGIVLGYSLADKLVVGLGEKVIILSPTGLTGMLGQMPLIKQFRVAGLFETGLYEFDSSVAYISLESAQQLFKMGTKVSGLEIKLDNLNQADAVAKKINARIGYPYTTETWFERNKNLFSWMQIEKWAAFIILSLIIMVAAFNIISTLIMVVMEKTKEIGILKSMGATSNGIMKIFMFEGSVVGIIGTVLGCVIGYALCWSQLTYRWFSLPPDIYFISALPIKMKVLDFILISLAAMFLSFIATVYPAWKASRLDPVQAIRYE
ncbi:MAG: lipoprotein-releasing ABC transporter permease subunit [candidate division KSB1 bacterium]|nr:lipoprotein-releasing ABC transporter permease subunit [candidate division KSB1 bacterium]